MSILLGDFVGGREIHAMFGQATDIPFGDGKDHRCQQPGDRDCRWGITRASRTLWNSMYAPSSVFSGFPIEAIRPCLVKQSDFKACKAWLRPLCAQVRCRTRTVKPGALFPYMSSVVPPGHVVAPRSTMRRSEPGMGLNAGEPSPVQ